jgi:tetratricopeptide (TPR) repeat protein
VFPNTNFYKVVFADPSIPRLIPRMSVCNPNVWPCTHMGPGGGYWHETPHAWEDPLGHYAYAQVFWHDEPEAALEHLTEAARLDPDSVAIRYSRAWMLQRMGQMAESLPDLEAARRLAPENARVLDLMGMAYLALDQPGQAEKVFREALARTPDEPEVVMHLGRALMALGREDEAQVWLEKYLKIRPPASPVLRKRLGMIELATLNPREQRQRAIGHFQREARDHPDHPAFQLHLSSLLLADRRTEEALREFRQLLALNAGAKVWEDAGSVLLSAGHYELAREFLQRAVEERPSARSRHRSAGVIVGDPVEQPHLLKGSVAPVQIEEIGLCVIGDEDVRPAVVIEIGNADAHPLAQRLAETGGLGHVLEPSATEVVVQAVGNSNVGLRMAIDLDASRRASLVGLRGPEGIIRQN